MARAPRSLVISKKDATIAFFARVASLPVGIELSFNNGSIVMLYRLMRTMRERAEDVESRRTLEQTPEGFRHVKTPVIIGGTGGSGTRALSNVLQYAGFKLGQNLNNDNDSLDVAQFLAHWVPQWIEAGNTELSGVRQERMDRHFLAALARLRGDDVKTDDLWLVKNPRLMYLLPFLNRHFPTFKFIHMVRDGRDMAFSKNQGQLAYLGSKFLKNDVDKTNPVHSARLWNEANKKARETAADILPGRYHPVSYERLCSAPAEEARKVMEFLEMDVDVEAATRDIKPPSSIGRWREQDEALQREVETTCAESLELFGYQLIF